MKRKAAIELRAVLLVTLLGVAIGVADVDSIEAGSSSRFGAATKLRVPWRCISIRPDRKSLVLLYPHLDGDTIRRHRVVAESKESESAVRITVVEILTVEGSGDFIAGPRSIALRLERPLGARKLTRGPVDALVNFRFPDQWRGQRLEVRRRCSI